MEVFSTCGHLGNDLQCDNYAPSKMNAVRGFGLLIILADICKTQTPFETTYVGHNATLTWPLDHPVRGIFLRDISLSTADKHYWFELISGDHWESSDSRIQVRLTPPEAMYDRFSHATEVGVTINNITDMDAGNYRLDYDFPPADLPSAALYVFKKPTQPRITYNMDHHTLGSNVELLCNASLTSLPAEYNSRFGVEYTWTTQGLQSTYNIGGESLVIQRAKKADIGARISCTAREKNSTLVSDEAHLILDLFWLVNITFLDELHEMKVPVGNNVIAICQASCNPPCTYRWMEERLAISTGKELMLANISEGVETYTCVASNVLGSITKDISFLLPEITNFVSGPSLVLEGTDVNMTCTALGTDDMIIQIISASTDRTIKSSTGNKLEHIWKTIDCSRSGEYICRANNKWASARKALALDVKCPPKFNYTASGSQKSFFEENSDLSMVISILANPYPGEDAMVLEHLSQDGTQRVSSHQLSINRQTSSITLEINSIQMDDYGMYTLAVWNEYGHSMFLFEIESPQGGTSPAMITISVLLAIVIVAAVITAILWYRKRLCKPKSNGGRQQEESMEPPAYENTTFAGPQPSNDEDNGIEDTYDNLGSNRETVTQPSYQAIGLHNKVGKRGQSAQAVVYEDVTISSG